MGIPNIRGDCAALVPPYGMKRCVVVGGAPIEDYGFLRKVFKEGDYIIACDSGLRHLEALGVTPHLIVGDFDSHPDPHLPVETIVLPREKDDTDTVYGVKEGLRRGFDDFLLLGMVGARLDHTLGNVSILLMLHTLGKRGRLLDDHSEMEIVGREPVEIGDSYPYFSLLNISGTAKGITIENAKYPLQGAEITCEYQYGVSNQVLPGQTARVWVEDGRLLLVKVRTDQ